jgi:hypothetical protein
LADFDGDGRLDLYTGSFEGSVCVLFAKGAGEFAEPVKLLDKSGAPLRLGLFWDSSVKPTHWVAAQTAKFPEELGISAAAVDWEGDGDLDLVLGAYHGRMYLRLNLGTAKAAAFSTEDVLLEAEGEPVMVKSGHAMPHVADWDGDGRWDLLSGSLEGGVRWWRNVGTKEAPKFAAPLVLVPDCTGTMDTPGTRTQARVCDFDGDGRLDLLVGDYRVDQSLHRGYVWGYRRLPAP